MSQCCQEELVRVFYPGVNTTDTVTSFGVDAYTGTVLVQDLVDVGMLYILKGLDGSNMICGILTVGKGSASLIIGGNTIKPTPIPTVEFIGGRPEDKRR